MIYYANFSANNGRTIPPKPLEFAWKEEAIQAIREATLKVHDKSYRGGNISSCSVWYIEDGRRWQVYKALICGDSKIFYYISREVLCLGPTSKEEGTKAMKMILNK